MAEIVLHPTHSNYCKECIYYTGKGCASEGYNKNAYKCNCEWHYCKYKKKKKER